MIMKKITVSMALGFSLTAAGGVHAYEAVVVKDGAMIRGKVTLQGSAPPPKKVLIGKDNEVCGQGHAEQDVVRVSVDGGLVGVVVYLEQVDKGKAWSTNARYELDQQKCAFSPALQVMPRGAELSIKNSDPVLHNVHPYEIIGSSRRTLFNLAQPTKGQTNVVKIEARRGRAIELSCDAHNWMSGWVYVVDNPYFAVVSADGSFEIGDVPPGEYKLMAWHPALGTLDQTMKATAKGKTDVSFAFKPQQ